MSWILRHLYRCITCYGCRILPFCVCCPKQPSLVKTSRPADGDVVHVPNHEDNGVSILTFNCQLLLWHTDTERARKIALQIIEEGPHIVCLQEVFDDEARAAIADGLKDEYPYYVSRAGFKAACGLGEDSGLMIFSKFPIEKVKFVLFYNCVCGLSDSVASKGAVRADIRIDGKIVRVINTHLYASYMAVEERIEQLECIADYIDDTDTDVHGIVLCGDLNIPGDEDEYFSVLKNKAYRFNKWKDVYRAVNPNLDTHLGCTAVPPLGMDPVEAEQFPCERLDYFFDPFNSLHWAECEVEPMEYLSDHLALRGRFYMKPPKQKKQQHHRVPSNELLSPPSTKRKGLQSNSPVNANDLVPYSPPAHRGRIILRRENSGSLRIPLSIVESEAEERRRTHSHDRESNEASILSVADEDETTHPRAGKRTAKAKQEGAHAKSEGTDGEDEEKEECISDDENDSKLEATSDMVSTSGRKDRKYGHDDDGNLNHARLDSDESLKRYQTATFDVLRRQATMSQRSRTFIQSQNESRKYSTYSARFPYKDKMPMRVVIPVRDRHRPDCCCAGCCLIRPYKKPPKRENEIEVSITQPYDGAARMNNNRHIRRDSKNHSYRNVYRGYPDATTASTHHGHEDDRHRHSDEEEKKDAKESMKPAAAEGKEKPVEEKQEKILTGGTLRMAGILQRQLADDDKETETQTTPRGDVSPRDEMTTESSKSTTTNETSSKENETSVAPRVSRNDGDAVSEADIELKEEEEDGDEDGNDGSSEIVSKEDTQNEEEVSSAPSSRRGISLIVSKGTSSTSLQTESEVVSNTDSRQPLADHRSTSSPTNEPEVASPPNSPNPSSSSAHQRSSSSLKQIP